MDGRTESLLPLLACEHSLPSPAWWEVNCAISWWRTSTSSSKVYLCSLLVLVRRLRGCGCWWWRLLFSSLLPSRFLLSVCCPCALLCSHKLTAEWSGGRIFALDAFPRAARAAIAWLGSVFFRIRCFVYSGVSVARESEQEREGVRFSCVIWRLRCSRGDGIWWDDFSVQQQLWWWFLTQCKGGRNQGMCCGCLSVLEWERMSNSTVTPMSLTLLQECCFRERNQAHEWRRNAWLGGEAWSLVKMV